MKRIVRLRLIFIAWAGWQPALINRTNRHLPHRHPGENYFGRYCQPPGKAQPAMWPVARASIVIAASGQTSAC
jgi:hypothetical protein